MKKINILFILIFMYSVSAYSQDKAKEYVPLPIDVLAYDSVMEAKSGVIRDSSYPDYELKYLDLPADSLNRLLSKKQVLSNYINKYLQYPQAALDAKKQGVVLAEFSVDKESKIENLKILSSFDSECSDAVKNMIDSISLSDVQLFWGKSKQLLGIHFRPADSIKIQVVDRLFCESMPEFPGGYDSLQQFIRKNLLHPVIDGNIQGRVVVRFVVTRDGNVECPHVIKGIHPLFDEEALRIVRSMPRWVAGKQDGEYVDCFYTIPIAFRY